MPDGEPWGVLLDRYSPVDRVDGYHIAEFGPPSCVTIRSGTAPARAALTGPERALSTGRLPLLQYERHHA